MKHLVDLDDELLARAKACLGTDTMKATINQALRAVTKERAARQREALEQPGEIFAKLPPFDRSQMW